MRQLQLRFLAAVAVIAMLAVSGCHSSVPTPNRSEQVLVGASPGGADPGAGVSKVRFVDVAAKAGLDYRWIIDAPRPLNLMQTIGNGCAFLDYNNDGNLDILLVGPHPALFKGDGHGHFVNVTHETGLDTLRGDFLGCAVGDYDNDGFDDIYLSAYQGGALLHNESGKRFVDVTREAGIAPQPFGTSCAFLNLGKSQKDGQERLSLYIGNYIVFDSTTRPQLCRVGDHITACGPNAYKPRQGVLYRNVDGKRFIDDTPRWIHGSTSGKVLGAVPADFDATGSQSLYLANDERPGDLMQCDNDRFTDIGASSGTAYDANAREHGGMGADWGDYDNDGRLDLLVATFIDEPTCVYHNDGHDLFTESSASLGIATPSMPYVKFGAKWIDADNDGWLDVLISNGHTQDNAADVHPGQAYREPTQFFANQGGTALTLSPSSLAGDAGRPIVGRGLAIGDFDNDGRVDALVVDSEGTPILLHNETPAAGHWLEVRLTGTHSNRDGQGALLTVKTGGKKLLRQCTTAGSYLSASDRRVHFGLGAATRIDSLTIRWTSGIVQTLQDVQVDRIIDVREAVS